MEEECKHEMVRSGCADCRGLGDVADPYDGVSIVKRYGSAQYKASCWLFPEKHTIWEGGQFARAFLDDGSPPGDRPSGYICNKCTRKIDSRG